MLTLSGIDRPGVVRLLLGYGLELRVLPAAEPIAASYWGEREAGLRGNTLFARLDTPLHSILHEAAHYICMTPQRRAALQLLLADALGRIGHERLCADMDAWGYSFRLGAAQAWFECDAEDSRAWLQQHGIIDPHSRLTGSLRS